MILLPAFRNTVFLLFACLAYAYTNAATTPNLFIKGQVLHFDKHRDQQTIRFVIRELVGQPEKTIATIRPDGSFTFEALIAQPQDILLHYGAFATLLCAPSDTLRMTIDADIFANPSNQRPHEKYFVQIMGGTNAANNKLVQAYLLQQTDKAQAEQDAVKANTATQYLQHIRLREQQAQSFLQNFLRGHKATALFTAWATDNITYSARRDLLRYRWENLSLNNRKRQDMALPDNYFSFLDSCNMNDSSVISAAHADFLHEFYMYTRDEINKTDAIKNNPLKTASDSLLYIQSFSSALQNRSAGFTREVFLSKYYTILLNGKMVRELQTVYREEDIPNRFLRNKIAAQLISAGQFLANQEMPRDAKLQGLNNSITRPLIDTLVNRYKGNVIYVDFWAPWCAPCLEAMPYSKQLQAAYAGKKIVFVFLSNRSQDNVWKATIANNQLTGEHFNITEDQYNILAERFKITGIPHYVLIDKEGNIVLDNAPGPKETGALKKQLDRLLL